MSFGKFRISALCVAVLLGAAFAFLEKGEIKTAASMGELPRPQCRLSLCARVAVGKNVLRLSFPRHTRSARGEGAETVVREVEFVRWGEEDQLCRPIAEVERPGRYQISLEPMGGLLSDLSLHCEEPSGVLHSTAPNAEPLLFPRSFILALR